MNYNSCKLGGLFFCLAATLAVADLSACAKPDAKPAAKPTAPAVKASAKPEVKTDAKADAKPSGGMAGAGKWVPAELTISGHGCDVLIPGDYTLSEFLPPTGKLFCFRGPAHPDKKTAVFNVTIAPSQKGAEIPSEHMVMDVMLKPHRTSLAEYKEQKEPIFSNGGHEFKGMSFSGKTKEGKKNSGFVYLTQDKDTYFILFAQDEEPFAAQALPLLLKSAKGCQIKKQ